MTQYLKIRPRHIGRTRESIEAMANKILMFAVDHPNEEVTITFPRAVIAVQVMQRVAELYPRAIAATNEDGE
jgi:hypothetical protein